MSMDYIRSTYNVPAKRGGRIEYTGTDASKPVQGTIIGSECGHLCILLDGAKFARRFHPTWELRYLSDDETAEGQA